MYKTKYLGYDVCVVPYRTGGGWDNSTDEVFRWQIVGGDGVLDEGFAYSLTHAMRYAAACVKANTKECV